MSRVLIVSTAVFTVPPLGYGGVEIEVFYLAKGLKELGHQVSVVCPKGSVLPDGVEAMMYLSPDQGNPEYQTYLQYKDRIPEFDIVLDHSWQMLPYLYQMQNRKCPPIIHHCYGLSVVEPLLSIIPRLVACSQWHAEHLNTSTGLPVEYVYLAVDTEHYHVDSTKKREHLLLLQRLSPYKGAMDFVALCYHLGIPGKIIGEDKFVEDQEYICKLMSLCDGKHIEYIGPLPNLSQKKVDLIQRAIALVHPVKKEYGGEGFGILYPESMCCGTPVLTTDQGAAKEVLDINGGRVFNSIQETINFIESGGLGQFNTERVREQGEKFSVQNMAVRYNELISQVLQGKVW